MRRAAVRFVVYALTLTALPGRLAQAESEPPPVTLERPVILRSELASPPPAPAAVNQPDRLRQVLRPGKTYVTHLKGTLTIRAVDQELIANVVVTLNYAFEARIDRALGYPTFDPHGDPIPSASGTIQAVPDDRLSVLEPGERATISRVDDTSPDKLRYLGTMGLYPDTEVEIVERQPFGGPLLVRVGGAEHYVGTELADTIHVERSL